VCFFSAVPRKAGIVFFPAFCFFIAKGDIQLAYYILEKDFALRGWKMLPFGLRYPNPRLTDFFDQEDYKPSASRLSSRSVPRT
jgi:hypothetical protein